MPLVVFILLAIHSYLGVHLIRRYAEKRQLLDHPNNRSSHSAPTPRGGGLAIVVLVTGAGLWSIYETGLSRNLIYILCAAVIAWLGWRDDIHSLSPRIRFAVQGIVAVISIMGLGYFKSVTIPLFGVLHLGIVGIAITFFWIVGLTNAYNFMDGIDGIAGGVTGEIRLPFGLPCRSARAVWVFSLTTGRPQEFSWATLPAPFSVIVSRYCLCFPRTKAATP